MKKGRPDIFRGHLVMVILVIFDFGNTIFAHY